MRLQVINIFLQRWPSISSSKEHLQQSAYQDASQHCQRPLICIPSELRDSVGHSFGSFIHSLLLSHSSLTTPSEPASLSRALHLVPCFPYSNSPRSPQKGFLISIYSPFPGPIFAPSILYTLPCFVFLFALSDKCSKLVHVLSPPLEYKLFWARTSSLVHTQYQIKSSGVISKET